MTYDAFSRKYRPRSFSEVIGQEHIVRTLKNSIKMGRVSHAYIFSGSRGIGKTTIARIMAKALNCRNPVDFEPCNRCENCVEIDRGSFPDMYEIDAASNRGIDDIRTLRDNVNYAPIKGSYKVYIIDEAHMLTKEAFNALLKTLEEPPPRNIFILATTESYKIPDTIKSRCQVFVFKPPTKHQIKAYLTRILEKEGIEYQQDALSLLVEEAEGGMRDFASLLDQAVVFSEGRLTTKAVEDLLGIIPGGYVNQMINHIRDMDLKPAVNLIEKIQSEGYDLHVFWKQLTDKLHQELVKVSTEESGEFFNVEDQKRLIYILNLFNKATVESKNFQNPKNIFQLYVLKLKYLEYIKPVEQLFNASFQPPTQHQTKKADAPYPVNDKTEAKVNKPGSTQTDLSHIYKALKTEPILVSILPKFEVQELEDKVIFKTKDGIAGEFFYEHKEKLQQLLGKPVKISYPSLGEKEKVKKTTKRDESVDKILELFPGSKILKYESKEE